MWWRVLFGKQPVIDAILVIQSTSWWIAQFLSTRPPEVCWLLLPLLCYTPVFSSNYKLRQEDCILIFFFLPWWATLQHWSFASSFFSTLLSKYPSLFSTGLVFMKPYRFLKMSRVKPLWAYSNARLASVSIGPWSAYTDNLRASCEEYYAFERVSYFKCMLSGNFRS